MSRVAAAALGIALALGGLFAFGRAFPAKSAVAQPVAVRLVADDVGALREVWLHYVPELEPSFAAAERDFLGSLPADVRVVVVLRRGTRPALDAFLARIGVARALRVVEVDTPLGIWAKDRALVLDPRAEERTVLLTPTRPRAGESSRPDDWGIVPAVVAQIPSDYEVRPLPIAFDAGDFAVSGRRVLFDVNLFARNRSRGFASPAELRTKLAPILGRDVVMLGTDVGDVPRHHMSMYMAPIGDDTVLVGDPEAGARIVGRTYAPGEASLETGEPLAADLTPTTIARFERAAQDLRSAGFHVVRIPTVVFDDKTYFAYTNGIYETRGASKTAWVPSFDVPALDRAAREVYEAQGFRVIPVSVRALYTHHGTVGCLVNVTARG
jgi:hypothetical protein